MSTLWTFGDSFTFGYGCRADGPLTEYYYKYKRDGDHIWPVFLAHKLDMNLINCGKCGASNDYILDSMINNFNKINRGDYVILGKTHSQRFDVKNQETNELFTVITRDLDKNNISKSYTQQEKETLINFSYYFARDNLFKERQNIRFNFVKNRLFNEKNISFYYEWCLSDINDDFERIANHSNNEFEDAHLSFNGHREMFEFIYDKIKNKNGISSSGDINGGKKII